MANVTFNDLPNRTTVGNNDFFVINSSDRTVLPEGKVGFNVLKTAIQSNTLTTNYFRNTINNVQVKTAATGDNLITINDTGKLFTFPKKNSNAYGIFQLSCRRTGPVPLTNVLAFFNLLWYNRATQTTNAVGLLGSLDPLSLPINNGSGSPSSSTIHNTFLSIPVGDGIGFMQLEVSFSQNLPSARAIVETSSWLFQTT